MSTIITKARRRANEGAGWEDLKVELGMTEAEARYIVFGRSLYGKWKARQEAKAS